MLTVEGFFACLRVGTLDFWFVLDRLHRTFRPRVAAYRSRVESLTSPVPASIRATED